MKKFLIPVLSIMLLLPFMYGGCLSTDDIAQQFFDINLPDLAGTWQGPGHWFDSELTENFVEIVLTLESDGDISNATLNDLSFADVLNTNTAVTGTVSHFEADLVEFNFSNNYTGGIIFDSSDLKYLYFFSHDVVDNPFADGTLQQGAITLPNASDLDMYGSWSGFGFEFDDLLDTAERFSINNFVVSQPSLALEVAGTDQDGNAFTGELFLDNGTYGNFSGILTNDLEESVTIAFGFMSPDKNRIGFLMWPYPYSPGDWWAAVLLKKPGT